MQTDVALGGRRGQQPLWERGCWPLRPSYIQANLRKFIITLFGKILMTANQDQLRRLPSVDELLQSATGQQLSEQHTRTLALHAIRASLNEARLAIFQGE